MLFFFTHSINFELLLSLSDGKIHIQTPDSCRMGKTYILPFPPSQARVSDLFYRLHFPALLDLVRTLFWPPQVSNLWILLWFLWVLMGFKPWPFFKVFFQIYPVFLLLEAEASSKLLDSGLKSENNFSISDDLGDSLSLSLVVDNISEVLDDPVESQLIRKISCSYHFDES